MKHAGRPLAPWEIWRNPLITRFIRSRLRLRGAAFWLVSTAIATVFTFAMVYIAGAEREFLSGQDGARATIIPLLIIQGICLMLLGTGSVASGIINEKVAQTLDYQRLTPLTPASKIIGYLFGLPIREYAMAAIPLPFLIFAFIRGAVPIGAIISVSSVVISSVLLYHMTGFVAGMVTEKWKGSARLAQGLVIALYLILPNFSHLGLIFLEYLTIRPVIAEQLFPLLENTFGNDGNGFSQLGQRQVPFFNFEISPTLFSLLAQGILIVTFFTMIRRKWQQASQHILGKRFALILLPLFLLILIGNLWPTLTRTSPFPLLTIATGQNADEIVAIVLPLVFLTFAAAFAAVLISIVTPTPHESLRGWRRAAKYNLPRPPGHWDEATAWRFTLTLIATGWIAFAVLIFQLHAHDYTSAFPQYLAGAMRLALAYALSLVYFWVLTERFGLRRTSLVILVTWIVPLLFAIFLAAFSDSFARTALYVSALSPLSLFFLALPTPENAPGFIGDTASTFTHAYIFGCIVISCAFAWFLHRHRKFLRPHRETASPTNPRTS